MNIQLIVFQVFLDHWSIVVHVNDSFLEPDRFIRFQSSRCYYLTSFSIGSYWNVARQAAGGISQMETGNDLPEREILGFQASQELARESYVLWISNELIAMYKTSVIAETFRVHILFTS